MVYSFARVNAVLEIKVRNYFMQGRRGWVRLHEKGGKQHESPATTIWNATSMNTSPPLASPMITMDLCFAPRPARPASLPATRCGSRTPTA
jgi:hypothetical protein